MDKWKQCFLFIFTIFYSLVIYAEAPSGIWTTIDDKTGGRRFVIQFESGPQDELYGKILMVYPETRDSYYCENCPEPFKKQHLDSMYYFWGLKEKSPNIWTDGSIIDPKSGKIYNLSLNVKSHKIYARSYVGISFLGRTQIWVKHHSY